jgi:hypothetical protein
VATETERTDREALLRELMMEEEGGNDGDGAEGDRFVSLSSYCTT